MMFLKRHYTLELIDDFSITDERIEKALHELNIVNKYLGGNSTSIKGIKDIAKNNPQKHQINILDVGSGGSDLFKIIKNKTTISFHNVNVDLNKGACKFSKKQFPTTSVVCSNAFSLPFKEESFDLVHTSQFLHHFKEDDITILIKKFLQLSKYGIVINDLQRSVLALAGIKLLTILFSKSELLKNDAPLSVKRGFTKPEILLILRKSNIHNYRIKRKWAFRWLIVIYK